MPHDIEISLNQNISDPLAMGQPAQASEVLKVAEETMNAGGKATVILDHAIPDAVMATYETAAEIQAWRNRLNDLQQSSGKPLLD